MKHSSLKNSLYSPGWHIANVQTSIPRLQIENISAALSKNEMYFVSPLVWLATSMARATACLAVVYFFNSQSLIFNPQSSFFMSSQLGSMPYNHQNTDDDEYHYGNWNVTPEMLYETDTDDEYLEYKYSDSDRKEPSFGKNGLAMLERPPRGDLVCEKLINYFLHCSHDAFISPMSRFINVAFLGMVPS